MYLYLYSIFSLQYFEVHNYLQKLEYLERPKLTNCLLLVLPGKNEKRVLHIPTFHNDPWRWPLNLVVQCFTGPFVREDLKVVGSVILVFSVAEPEPEPIFWSVGSESRSRSRGIFQQKSKKIKALFLY